MPFKNSPIAFNSPPNFYKLLGSVSKNNPYIKHHTTYLSKKKKSGPRKDRGPKQLA